MTSSSSSGPPIPITKPILGEPEIDAVRRVLESGWVTQGPEVAAFETEFASYANVRPEHAVAVSSCTAALHLALHALGISSGDEVITVSHSFIATANAIRYTGADPVFVDIQLDDFNIDPARIEEAITPRTIAIMCVHQIGMPCRIDEISEIATRHGLKLIEDAACAAGSAIKNPDGGWQKIGAPYGDVTCFSFHPRKMITTGDGGMIIAKDEALAARLRRLRQHGMSVNDLVRHRSHKPVFETYDELGFNYRMTDIQAAIGREQLKRLDKLVASRRDLAHRYSALLAKVPGVTVPQEREGVRTNWQSYCVLLPETASQMAVMDYMQQQGISVRRGVMCTHKEPAYARHKVTHDLSLSEIAQMRGVILPLFDGLQDKDMIRVAAALQQGLLTS